MYWSVKGTPCREEGTHRAKLSSPAEHVPALQWGQAGLSRLLLPPPILARLGFPMTVAASPQSGGGRQGLCLTSLMSEMAGIREGGWTLPCGCHNASEYSG